MNRLLLLGVFLLSACGGGQTDPAADAAPLALARTAAETVTTPSIADYCANSGTAKAAQITTDTFKLSGPNAIGGRGDFVLANQQALFVISGMGLQKSYYHYPGILVDAVAVAGCQQQTPDHFFELPLMVGKLNAVHQPQSTFRAFQAQQIEVINDGRDGRAAIVRATGSDSIYWLLELTLMGDAVLDGMPKGLSDPLDLKIEVDYILQPDSPTLNIQYRLINTRDSFNSYNIAFVLMSSGEGPTLNTFSAFDLNLQGLALEHGIPWVSSTGDGSTTIFSARTDALTTTRISGVDALLDARQLANTYGGQLLTASGTALDSRLQQFDVTVSEGDELTAIQRHLEQVPLQWPVVETPLQIRVTDSLSGAPLANAALHFQTRKQQFLQGWPWETFLLAHTDAQGLFSASVPLLRYLDDQWYRVVVSAPGRAASAPIALQRADQNGNQLQAFDVALQGEGALHYAIVDEDGQPSPAKLTLFQNGRILEHLYSVSGSGDHKLAPGHYHVGISRGFEYGVEEVEIDIPESGMAPLNVTLKHWVDTSGYLSYDAHVHSAPSPDSEVSKEDRIRTAVAAGLDIVVATDHEIITDLAPAVKNVGAENLIGTIVGQEVTASLPNHTIAFPLQRDSDKVRDFVPWYGLDLAGIFALEKQFGAQIRTFAHPRGSYLDIVQWDRIAGAPGADVDPRTLGLAADAALWSWDFEAMELMNGHQQVFSSGILEDWMSFLNHGHRIIATGASDVHDAETPGTPRTYFRSATDRGAAFSMNEMVSSIVGGDVLVSLGAFARVKVNAAAGMGETVTDQDGSIDLALEVQAIPQIDVTELRIYVNCDEVKRISASNPVDSAQKFQGVIPLPVPLDQDAYVVVLGLGAERLPAVFESFAPSGVPRFVTNPVYIDVDGNGVFDAPGGKTCQLDAAS